MDLAEDNRKHWNDLASTYDSKPWQQKIVNQVSSEIRNRLDWIGVDWIDDKATKSSSRGTLQKQVRVLDFACGPGTVSRALAPYASEFRGVDISENMVREYNTRAANLGFPPTEMFATTGNLLDPSGPSANLLGPDLYNFDLAVVGMGFHHLEHPALATKRLVERLKPAEGVILIIDCLPHSMEDLPSEFRPIIANHGFSKEDMKTLFKEAGCDDFGFVVFEEPIKMGDDGKIERRGFMARARRVK
ncbi:MAG: hypothetical protein M1835_000377 [Candelina submexicana]|nr:MAG: hypothetical protein M1835_000377 [Candelina submexicana]